MPRRESTGFWRLAGTSHAFWGAFSGPSSLHSGKWSGQSSQLAVIWAAVSNLALRTAAESAGTRAAQLTLQARGMQTIAARYPHCSLDACWWSCKAVQGSLCCWQARARHPRAARHRPEIALL